MSLPLLHVRVRRIDSGMAGAAVAAEDKSLQGGRENFLEKIVLDVSKPPAFCIINSELTFIIKGREYADSKRCDSKKAFG